MHPHLEESGHSAGQRMTAKAFADSAELTKEYWMESGKEHVEKRATENLNTKKAKNVIMFLGDGMGHNSVGECKLSCIKFS